MSKQPGWERDRSAKRLQMTGRDIDDEAPDLALPAFLQLRGHDFDVPVHQEPGLTIELEKAASDEAAEILPQDCCVLSGVRTSIGTSVSHLPDAGKEQLHDLPV
jgi:hypothetical protein